MATRPLHFILLADCSGSMQVNAKIEALNRAIRETLPHMRKAALENTDATVLVRTICFSNGAKWHDPTPTPIDQYRWVDVQAIKGGMTDMGQALRLVAEEMRSLAASEKVLRPVLVLVTDGHPTDDFESGLQALLATPLGKKAVRIAIAIGDDADQEPLQDFIDDPTDPTRTVLQANNPETLLSYIKWASTSVLTAVSKTVLGIAIPQAPDPITGPMTEITF